MAHNNTKLRAFRGGVELRGHVSLGVTTTRQVDSSGKAHGKGGRPRPRQPQQRPEELEELGGKADDVAPAMEMPESEPCPEEVERALELVQSLRSTGVHGPSGVPCGGEIVNFDLAVRFVRRYVRMLRERGPEKATPRVVFHWTAEENFGSILEENLRVPDGQGVKMKHGAALGRGVYTSPDFRFGKEDFGYGARACFMCLALTGEQETRHIRSGQKELGVAAGYDSIRGRLANRPCDTWVFPESDLLLPCFLVDELALDETRPVVASAIRVLRAPGLHDCAEHPTDAEESPPVSPDVLCGTNSSAMTSMPISTSRRWERRHRAEDCCVGGSVNGTGPKNRWRVSALSEESPGDSVGQNSDLTGQAVVAPHSVVRQRTGGVEFRSMDLRFAGEDYLIHQCHCGIVQTCAEGVAAVLFAMYPEADVYLQRRKSHRQPDQPGTISLHGRVVNLYGQLCPGGPLELGAAQASPYAALFPPGVGDTASERLAWFRACLAQLSAKLPKTASLALPARIGCGLAGGHWESYEAELHRFAEVNPSLGIVVYDWGE